MSGTEGEGKAQEERKRRGRLTNAERLGREGSPSLVSIEELLSKRKREEGQEEEEEAEEKWAFRDSKKMQRSPGRGEDIQRSLGRLWNEIREMREESRGGREDARRQGRELQEELKNLKEDLERREERWREERAEIRGRMRALEERIGQGEKRVEEKIKVMEQRVEGLRITGVTGGSGNGEGGRNTLERLEKRLEMREREDRRKNIIIKGMNTEGGEMRKEVEELLGEIGAKVEIEGVRLIGGGERGRGGIVWVRFKQLEQKREVMQRKKELRGRKERIEDDLTWKERRMQWMIKRAAAREEGRGRRVKVSYGRLWVDGVWWKWELFRGDGIAVI